MNTLFVMLMWLTFYYLFFHPLNLLEDFMYTIDPIYRKYAEGYDNDG